MKAEYINGDLTQFDVFCHQTNCFGKMGDKQIASKYPEVKNTDRRLYRLLGADELFGTIRCIKTSDGRICVNIYAQYGFGRGAVHTNYRMLQKCLDALVEFCIENLEYSKTVAFPCGMGCGAAGGDWDIVEPLLLAFAERIPQRVYIVRRNSQ